MSTWVALSSGTGFSDPLGLQRRGTEAQRRQQVATTPPGSGQARDGPTDFSCFPHVVSSHRAPQLGLTNMRGAICAGTRTVSGARPTPASSTPWCFRGQGRALGARLSWASPRSPPSVRGRAGEAPAAAGGRWCGTQSPGRGKARGEPLPVQTRVGFTAWEAGL